MSVGGVEWNVPFLEHMASLTHMVCDAPSGHRAVVFGVPRAALRDVPSLRFALGY